MDEPHVDIVRTEPLLGTSEVVARLVLVAETGIKVVDDEPEWAEIALRPITEAGKVLYPNENAKAFLEALNDHLGGTYVFATGLHNFESCQYPKRRTSLEPVEYPPKTLRKRGLSPSR